MHTPVYEVVAITGNQGMIAIGHRWALRQCHVGTGHFIPGNEGRPRTWKTLRDLDTWLQLNELQDNAVVIWPAAMLLREEGL